jgi:hypothetical protein
MVKVARDRGLRVFTLLSDVPGCETAAAPA